MANTVERRPVFLAVALILIGALLLADRADLFEFSWPWILVIIGAGFLIQAVVQHSDSPVFVGVLLLAFGLIFLADKMFWLPWRMHHTWPLLLIAIGVAFLASYLARPSRSGPIIAGGLLILLGLFFLLADMRILHWYWVVDVLSFWPLALLALGIYLLVRPR
ncbi:MAG TPA: hypothetical protein ENI92_02015 [Bacteroidetes bacterium]|nr:hypothetical protein [Bacteroidota bacterium]